MKKLKVILIGAGSRGKIYTDLMAQMPDKYEVVGVAEPIENRREYIRKKHNVPENMCFTTWEPLLDLGKVADVALICTMDQLHCAPALKAIENGYDLLLEKPISNDSKECDMVAKAADKAGVRVVICTVLRYTPFFRAIKDMIKDGTLGKIQSINHEECVGHIHQSHSFVRGNWGNEERSSCMLLQKSCHDMDILQWLVGAQVKKVQSFGSLSYFTKENAPVGAPDYCVQGCPATDCPYNAVKLYYDDKNNDWFREAATHMVKPSDEEVMKAISTTQYGKCVFKCDNDVVDHQVVSLLFDNGTTVNFTMNAFNEGGRFLHIFGTKGELHAAMDGGSPMRLFDLTTRSYKTIDITAKDGLSNGHGGGDAGIVATFYDYITNQYDGDAVDPIKQVSDNHQLCFAAEVARKTNTVVDFDTFLKNL